MSYRLIHFMPDLIPIRMLSASGILAVAGLVGVPPSVAQPAARPEFDVASVKPTDPRSRATVNVHRFPGGRLAATSVTLKILITWAYGAQDIDVSGGPDWLDRAKFDIAAQGKDDADAFPLMVQALLEDRFKLAIRRETRELPIYALLLAKTGGKLGPNLHEAEVWDCPAEPPPTPAQIKSPLWTPWGGFHSMRGHLGGRRVTLRNLTSPLAAQLGRPSWMKLASRESSISLWIGHPMRIWEHREIRDKQSLRTVLRSLRPCGSDWASN